MSLLQSWSFRNILYWFSNKLENDVWMYAWATVILSSRIYEYYLLDYPSIGSSVDVSRLVPMLAMSLFVGTARTGSLIWMASPSTPKQTGMQTHTTKDKQGLFFGHLPLILLRRICLISTRAQISIPTSVFWITKFDRSYFSFATLYSILHGVPTREAGCRAYKVRIPMRWYVA